MTNIEDLAKNANRGSGDTQKKKKGYDDVPIDDIEDEEEKSKKSKKDGVVEKTKTEGGGEEKKEEEKKNGSDEDKKAGDKKEEEKKEDVMKDEEVSAKEPSSVKNYTTVQILKEKDIGTQTLKVRERMLQNTTVVKATEPGNGGPKDKPKENKKCCAIL